MSNKEDKQYYHYLIAAKVLFSTEQATDAGIEVQGVELNAVVLYEDTIINAADIGMAQRAVQIQFLKSINNDPSVKIHDVILLNLVNCGLQGNESFRDLGDIKPTLEVV